MASNRDVDESKTEKDPLKELAELQIKIVQPDLTPEQQLAVSLQLYLLYMNNKTVKLKSNNYVEQLKSLRANLRQLLNVSDEFSAKDVETVATLQTKLHTTLSPEERRNILNELSIFYQGSEKYFCNL